MNIYYIIIGIIVVALIYVIPIFYDNAKIVKKMKDVKIGDFYDSIEVVTEPDPFKRPAKSKFLWKILDIKEGYVQYIMTTDKGEVVGSNSRSRKLESFVRLNEKVELNKND